MNCRNKKDNESYKEGRRNNKNCRSNDSQQLPVRKIWKKKARERRQRLLLQYVTNVRLMPSILEDNTQMPQRNFDKKSCSC